MEPKQTKQPQLPGPTVAPRKKAPMMSKEQFDAMSDDEKDQAIQQIHVFHLQISTPLIEQLMTMFVRGELVNPGTGKVFDVPIEDVVVVVSTARDPITPDELKQKLLDNDKQVDVSVQLRSHMIAYMRARCDSSYKESIDRLKTQPDKDFFYCICFDLGKCTVAPQSLGPMPEPASSESRSDDLGPSGNAVAGELPDTDKPEPTEAA